MAEKQSGEPEEGMGAGDRSFLGCCHRIRGEAREWGTGLKGEGHKMKSNQQGDYLLVGEECKQETFWEEGY